MTDLNSIPPQMNGIGTDGVHVGIVDRVESGRIKLVKDDSGEGRHKGHHHFSAGTLIAGIEGQDVRLSANADVALLDETGDDGKPIN